MSFQCKKYGYEYDGNVNFWDVRYYLNMIEETRYSVDKQKLKEYFPLEKVNQGMLEIYQTLLGLTFTECKDGVDQWHEEVKLVSDFFSSFFSVWVRTTWMIFFMSSVPRSRHRDQRDVWLLLPGPSSP